MTDVVERAAAALAAFDLYWGDGGPVEAAHGYPYEIIRELLAEVRAGVVAEEPEWEYRAVACEPDTGDVYNSTSRPASSEQWARSDADLEEILHSDPDLPQLVLKVQCRRKAGPWVPVKQEGADQ